MAVITANASTQTAVTISGLGTLAASTYAASAAINLSALDPLDVIVELEATPGTVSGNKQALVFIKSSLDGTAFSTGPESGTTATDEPNLYLLGALPLNTNATQQRGQFSVAAALGWVPPWIKIVVKNDSGAAFTAGACDYATITGASA